MRTTTFGTIFVLVLVSAATNVFAQCDCAGASSDIRGTRYATAYEELKNADAVFYGQVVELKMIDIKPLRKDANNYELQITFRVEKAWRRDVDQYLTVREYSDDCIIGFQVAERWLVYARFDENKNLRVDYCTRTRIVYKNIDKDLKEFADRSEKQTRITRTRDNQ